MRRIRDGGTAYAEIQNLSREERAREHLVLGLRRLEGVVPREFEECTGIGLERLCGSELRRLADQGLVDWQPQRLRLAREGVFLYDTVAVALI
jgi:oxygen-independent coproporphyrinogen-3 oxidase